MKEIEIKGGSKVIIDEDFFGKATLDKWRISSWGYVVNGKGKYLHRIVMEAKEGEQIDHINRNKLDNRKENLRVCSCSENQWNRDKTRSNSSGFKGVSFHKKANKWQVYIRIKNIPKYIGIFPDKVSAAKAYDNEAKKLYGKFAFLNFN